MLFLTLLDLPTCKAAKSPNDHLLIGNKRTGITPTWTNLIFLICYATNDYLYAFNLYILLFTPQLFANFIMLDTDSERKWKLSIPHLLFIYLSS